MKVYLGIDTATPNLVLGLYSPERGVLGVYENGLEPHATKQIIPKLDNLLKQSKTEKNDLAGITVGVGPGSYTGIKVAIATAKGLARGLNIPLQGKSSLAAIAYSKLEDGETGIITLDARRGNVYYGVFARLGDTIKALSSEKKASLELLKDEYHNYRFIEDATPSAEYLASFSGFNNKTLIPNYL